MDREGTGYKARKLQEIQAGSSIVVSCCDASFAILQELVSTGRATCHAVLVYFSFIGGIISLDHLSSTNPALFLSLVSYPGL